MRILKTVKEIWCIFTLYQKKSFRGASISRKLNGILVWNAMGIILKKVDFLFIVHFCFYKLNILWTLDIGLMVRMFANGLGELGSIPGRVIPLLHLGVVAIEKGAFGSPSTTVTNFTLLTCRFITWRIARLKWNDIANTITISMWCACRYIFVSIAFICAELDNHKTAS